MSIVSVNFMQHEFQTLLTINNETILHESYKKTFRVEK